jgi:hypothetical protein
MTIIIPKQIEEVDEEFYKFLKVLQLDELQLPIKWDGERDFINFLEEKTTEFLNILDKNSIKKKIPLKIIKRIKDTLKKYLRGKTFEAYNNFRSILLSSEIISKWKYLGSPFEKNKNAPEFYYRARRTDPSHYSIQKREDIFHIPFEKRRQVKSQRYSIPGLPCLYLSTSIYTCWEELNRPDINWFYVSLFKYNGKRDAILDLSWSPATLSKYLVGFIKKKVIRKLKSSKDLNSKKLNNKSIIEDGKKWVANFLSCWPLLMACYIIVDNEEKPFNPHLIIPQFLMQLTLEKNSIYTAIKYFSTKITKDEQMFPGINTFDHIRNLNLAFPVKTLKEKGYCKSLGELFDFDSPISYQELMILKPSVFSSRYSNPLSLSEKKAYSIPYNTTFFGEIEKILKGRYIDKILYKLWEGINLEITRNISLNDPKLAIHNEVKKAFFDDFDKLTCKKRQERILDIIKQISPQDLSNLDMDLFKEEFKKFHDSIYLEIPIKDLN